VVHVKDLGPQFSYRGVFLIEYVRCQPRVTGRPSTLHRRAGNWARIHTYKRMHARTHTPARTRTHTCMCTRANLRTCTLTRTNAQLCTQAHRQPYPPPHHHHHHHSTTLFGWVAEGVIPYHFRSASASIKVTIVDGLPPTLVPAFSSTVVNPNQPRLQLSVDVDTHGDSSVSALCPGTW
jgi:hypothetical protein